MGQRTSALADQFEQAITDFAETIQQIPDDKWQAVSGPEGWTVAATAQNTRCMRGNLGFRSGSGNAETTEPARPPPVDSSGAPRRHGGGETTGSGWCRASPIWEGRP